MISEGSDTAIMASENSACITEINDNVEYIQIEKLL